MTLDRPEHALLLSCSRTSVSPALSDRIRLLAESNIDWSYLFRLGRRHAVLPLLFRQLQQHASMVVPEDQQHRLKTRYQENAARNVVLTAELTRLVKLLNNANIEVVPYKGPLLAQFAYGDLSLRRFVDLDVIVRKEDVLAARELLLADGYVSAKSLSGVQQDVLLRTQHNLQFTKDDRQLIVELHWEVASHLFASSVDSDQLWQTLKSAELAGVKVKTLCVEDLLFSLCIHGSRHLWERLSWICDIAELIRQRIDWNALLLRADQTDTERMFFLGLRLAHQLLDCELPVRVRELVLADKHLDVLVDGIAEKLFDGAEHVPATSGEIFRYNMKVRKSWLSRMRYFVYMLRPTDSDLSALKLPKGFGFAYYLVRPFRLLSKHS
jgi:Uncharacterised nucleotidyltransferase